MTQAGRILAFAAMTVEERAVIAEKHAQAVLNRVDAHEHECPRCARTKTVLPNWVCRNGACQPTCPTCGTDGPIVRTSDPDGPKTLAEVLAS